MGKCVCYPGQEQLGTHNEDAANLYMSDNAAPAGSLVVRSVVQLGGGDLFTALQAKHPNRARDRFQPILRHSYHRVTFGVNHVDFPKPLRLVLIPVQADRSSQLIAISFRSGRSTLSTGYPPCRSTNLCTNA